MKSVEIYKEVLKNITELPVIDCHTHLDAAHLSARGLHDILLYHMVISELYSAGCPNGSRLSESPDEKEKTSRIEQGIPFLENIKNTSCYWLMSTILKGLYGWDKPLTKENWKILDKIIIKKAEEKDRPRQILKKANIIKAGTELPLRGDGSYDDILFYALEWAFFMRNQWGIFDAPLYELEYASQFDKPTRPLPVTIQNRPAVKKTIKSVKDVKEAMAHYCRAIPYDTVKSTAQHISTDINYSTVSDEQMQTALDNRENAGPVARDIYASYLLEAFLKELENASPGFIFQFSLGAEPMPFETCSRLSQNTTMQIAEIISRHPRIQFQCFLSSKHGSHSMCTLCRELPNLTLVGYWWHNFFPGTIQGVIDERLDMLPTNKQMGFFSDAYCVEWAYAKSQLVRQEFASALARRVDRGQYTIDQALDIARKILKDTPEDVFQLKPFSPRE